MGECSGTSLDAALPLVLRLPGRSALWVSRQPVVRDPLPRDSVGNELTQARLDPRILVEGTEADARLIGITRVTAEERRAARAAEPLLPAAGGLPRAQILLAADDAKRARLRAGVGRGGGATTPLTARAVTVGGGHERRGDLEPDLATAASAEKRHSGADEHHQLTIPLPASKPVSATDRVERYAACAKR